MGNEVRLYITIVGGMLPYRSVVLAKHLLFGDIWVQVKEVLQVCNHISQWTDGKGFTGEGLQHEHVSLITSWKVSSHHETDTSARGYSQDVLYVM